MLGTLEELAARVGGRIVGDGSVRIDRVSAVEDATNDALTFATSEAYFASALASDAAAILVDDSLGKVPAAKPLLVVENARYALALLLQSMQPHKPRGPFRHPSAVVEPDAQLAAEVYVGAHAYIGNRTTIGSGGVVGAGAYVGDGVSIGESVWIHSGASIMSGTRIGDRVVLHSGCVIGSDGFGWAFVDGRSERIPRSATSCWKTMWRLVRTHASIAPRPAARESAPARRSTISCKSDTTAVSASIALLRH